jgi:hypothetical protein
MFRCPIAEFQWVVIRDGLKWFSYPWSMQDFSENFLTEWEKSEISVMWFLFGAILWILWFNRNDCVFNNLVIFSPVLSYLDYFCFSSIGWWRRGRRTRLRWKGWLMQSKLKQRRS